MAEKLSAKDIIKKYKEIKSRKGAGFARLEDGENLVRILVFVNEDEDKEQLYVEFMTHWIGGNSQICPKSVGETCPVCEYVETLKDDKSKGAKKIANAIRQKRRYYINVLMDGEIKVAEVGATVIEGIMSYVNDSDYGIGVFDLHEGYNFKIIKSGSGLDTDYDVKIAKQPSDVGKLPGKPIDLTQYLRVKDSEELESLLADEFEFPPRASDDDEEEEEEKPKNKSKKPPVDDDEEEEEEESDDEEEEEEESDDDDDESDDEEEEEEESDDDEEEEEEEEEKPAKDKKHAKGKKDYDDEIDSILGKKGGPNDKKKVKKGK